MFTYRGIGLYLSLLVALFKKNIGFWSIFHNRTLDTRPPKKQNCYV